MVLFEHFDVPLHQAMEWLRKDDQLDKDANSSEMEYAWRDILIEQLQLSRLEYQILTDSTKSLQELYGEPNAEEGATCKTVI